MIQDQLVDYIASQIKLGVTRDGIKSALISAGWAAADVEDSLKKAESMSGEKSPAGAVFKPATASPAMGSSASSIKVSDLISTPVTSPAKNAPVEIQKTVAPMTMNTTISESHDSAASPQKDKKTLVIMTIAGLLVLGLGATAGILVGQVANLKSQIASLTADSAAATTKLSQVTNAVNASTTDLTNKVAVLTAANQELLENLSFYTIPPTLIGPTSSEPFDELGTISGGGKAPYVFTTVHGAKLTVLNSKDAKVIAVLQPLVGASGNTDIAGTYTPGTPAVTVTTVSGTAL